MKKKVKNRILMAIFILVFALVAWKGITFALTFDDPSKMFKEGCLEDTAISICVMKCQTCEMETGIIYPNPQKPMAFLIDGRAVEFDSPYFFCKDLRNQENFNNPFFVPEPDLQRCLR